MIIFTIFGALLNDFVIFIDLYFKLQSTFILNELNFKLEYEIKVKNDLIESIESKTEKNSNQMIYFSRLISVILF